MRRIFILMAVLISAAAQGQKVIGEAGNRWDRKTTSPINKSNIAGWGDSQFEISPGVLFQLGLRSGRYVYNGGIAGETTLFIKNRMVADIEKHEWATVIWAGRNGVLNTPIRDVMPYIKQMVDSVRNGNYVIINLIHGGGEGTGTAAYDSISRFNDSLVARFGVRVFDANATVKTWYTSLPADQANLAQGVAPRSSRSDSIHLTDTAYRRLADSLFKYKYQYLGFTDNTIPTSEGIAAAFNANADATFSGLTVSNKLTNTAKIDGRTGVSEFQLNQTSATLGTQALTNNTFTSDLSGWTATNWQFANGGAQHISGNTSALSQVVTVEANATYEVKVWISRKTAGNIAQVSFLGATRSGLPNDGLGTYAFTSPTATTSTVSIIPSSLYDGTVDSVSVRRIDRDVFLPSARPQFSLKDASQNVVTSFIGNRFGVVGIGGVTINYGHPFSRVLDQSTFSLGVGSGVFPNGAMFTNTTGVGSNIANYVPMALGTTLVGTNLFNASNISYLENQTALGYNIFTGNTGYNNIGIGTALYTGITTFNRSIMLGNNLNFRSSSEAGQINIGGLIHGKGAVATGTNVAGNVGIGTNDPNTSAVLDLTSTTAGFLIPRMTTAQANAIPTRSVGLMVINTDSARVWYWNGSAWQGLRFTNEQPNTFSGGLTNTSGTVTNDLITPTSGSKTIVGGNAANNTLTIRGNNQNGSTNGNVGLSLQAAGSLSNPSLEIYNNGVVKVKSGAVYITRFATSATAEEGATTLGAPRYHFTGTTGTFTVPATVTVGGWQFTLFNAGTGDVTVNVSNSSNILFNTSGLTNTFTVGVGVSRTFTWDATGGYYTVD